MKYPVLVSPWIRIIEYPEHHLNDFCLFRALDGRWHAIGIMGTGSTSSPRSSSRPQAASGSSSGTGPWTNAA